MLYRPSLLMAHPSHTRLNDKCCVCQCYCTVQPSPGDAATVYSCVGSLEQETARIADRSHRPLATHIHNKVSQRLEQVPDEKPRLQQDAVLAHVDLRRHVGAVTQWQELVLPAGCKEKTRQLQ